MAFSVARRAAAVPLLLVNGTYRKTVRTYLDSSILQYQLQRLNKHGSLKGISYILRPSFFRMPHVCTWLNKSRLGNPLEFEKKRRKWKENVFCPLICAYAAHYISIHPHFYSKQIWWNFCFEIFIQSKKYLRQRIRDEFRMTFAHSLEDAWHYASVAKKQVWHTLFGMNVALVLNTLLVCLCLRLLKAWRFGFTCVCLAKWPKICGIDYL